MYFYKIMKDDILGLGLPKHTFTRLGQLLAGQKKFRNK